MHIALDLSQYYTAGEAAKAMSRRSKRPVSPAYMRQLVRYGRLPAIKIGGNYLYPKIDVHKYRVEPRGHKISRLMRQRAEEKAAMAK